jgi:UDP-N-acetylmuramoylalanine--D-glutamate ligase
MKVEGKTAVVVGLARSGIAAADFLVRHGAHVIATDRKDAEGMPSAVTGLADRGVLLELGGHRKATFERADLVVVSPGVPWDTPELEAARGAGAEVIGELEFGGRFIRGPVAAITGTKGKSTTTAALGAMLREAGFDVRVGGNIGTPVTTLLEGAREQTVWVLEVSSFQLEAADTFHPHVAVFLNLSADHLDRHPSFEAYGAAKARIFAHQTEADWAVVNADDAQVLALAQEGRARRVSFSEQPGSPPRACFQRGEARLHLDRRAETLFVRHTVRLPGAHLVLDVLAAATAARLLGTPPDRIQTAVSEFRGAEHVLEHVGDVDGVRFYNDSKATNMAAARASLESFKGGVHVILGGRHKAGDFRDLREPLGLVGREVLAIGEARPLIRAALADVLPVVECDSLEQAVQRGFEAAQEDDVVLLAPACASFDMFVDYAARGAAFKAAARTLAAAHSQGACGEVF